jgi:hypothetical protein
MSKTPTLEELESGPWPTFMEALKKSVRKSDAPYSHCNNCQWKYCGEPESHGAWCYMFEDPREFCGQYKKRH